jgi:diamine N-acetyltransferase
MKIIPGKPADAEKIAWVVSVANKDVAESFDLTFENAPKHPSFCTLDWIVADFKRGEKYFLFKEEEVVKGCVAFEQPDPETAYLNRLSVLPQYRHRGIGTALVKYILEYAKSRNILYVSIGIIAEHEILKHWYDNLGFIRGNIQKFEHLPFNVQYMRYEL